MKNRLSILGSFCLSVLLAFAVAGCKKGSATESGSKAFASASPELKAAWDKATGAAKTNDYATAVLTFQALRGQPNLTPEQDKALADAAQEVSDRMYDAANKGDAKAKAALDEIRKARSR